MYFTYNHFLPLTQLLSQLKSPLPLSQRQQSRPQQSASSSPPAACLLLPPCHRLLKQREPPCEHPVQVMSPFCSKLFTTSHPIQNNTQKSFIAYFLTLSSPNLPISHSFPATLASLPFLGPLPLLFSLSGMFYAQIFVLSFISFRSLFKHHLPKEDSPNCSQTQTPPHSLFPYHDLLFLFALTT